MIEPGGGSDVQAMRTTAPCRRGRIMVDGTKTWITKARHVGLVALLCKTDSKARPTQRGSSILLMEEAPGITVSKDLPKLGNGTFDRVTARVMDEFGAAHR